MSALLGWKPSLVLLELLLLVAIGICCVVVPFAEPAAAAAAAAVATCDAVEGWVPAGRRGGECAEGVVLGGGEGLAAVL